MKTLFTLLALSALTLPAAAAAPSRTDAACAAEDMQLAYYWLAPDLEAGVRSRATSCHPGRKTVTIPEWLEKSRPAMLEKKAWKDPEEGELSEARLWQDAFSILYELADMAGKKALPSSPGDISAAELETALGDIRLRLIMASDRLYKSGFDRSLDGRGGAVAAAFGGAVKALDSATGAVERKDKAGVDAGLEGALASARAAFAALTGPVPAAKPAPRYEPEPRLLPGYRGASLPLSGSQVMFLSPGDRVDMLVTFDALMADDRREKVTATILQNVVVVKVDKPETPDGTGLVQLLVNPNEAQYAALSLVQGGSIALARRAKGDVELHPMEIASFKRLLK